MTRVSKPATGMALAACLAKLPMTRTHAAELDSGAVSNCDGWSTADIFEVSETSLHANSPETITARIGYPTNQSA